MRARKHAFTDNWEDLNQPQGFSSISTFDGDDWEWGDADDNEDESDLDYLDSHGFAIEDEEE